MKTATLVTQPESATATSEVLPTNDAQANSVESHRPVTLAPSSNVRLKQTKTTIKKVTKQRKRNGEIQTIILWEVSTGSALSKVYATPSGDRELFTVSYWAKGARKREVLPTWDAAIEAAKRANRDIGDGGVNAPDIAPQKRLPCARALAILAPFDLEIDFVASRYVEMIKLTNGQDPLGMVERHLQKNPINLKVKTVKEAVEEMVGVKRSDKLSDRYVKQLDYNLTRFAGRFRGRLGDVNGTDVDKWLRELKVGPRTRNNLRSSVKALFKFAVARKYLPKDHDEIEAVPVAKDGRVSERGTV
jgi:hypothetical protein